MKKLSLILAIVLITATLGCVQTGIAFAADSVYSFVLDDLQKDSNFNELDYLAIDDDYSLNVIQVAESSDGELFVYVYQPYRNARGLLASSITLARGKSGINYSQDLSFVNYKLTYLNSSDVFYKYKITNFQLSTDEVRYYNVAAISRPFDSTIDEPAPNGNKISEKAYTVNKLWTATTDGDNVSYKMEETEVVRITSKVVGYVNYSDGYKMSFGNFTTGATSAHFVAFSTDWQIDKLMEVEVEFKEQEVRYKWCANIAHPWHFKQKYDYSKCDVVPHPNIVLHDYDKAATNVGVNFADKHEWDRIMTSADFLAYHDDENGEYQLVTEDEESISKQQWVLSYYETPILQEMDLGWQTFLNPISVFWKGEIELKYTEVYDLVILRFMFQKDGTTYNLGVVDNKQTGSGKPSNIPNQVADWQNKLEDLSDVFKSIENFFAAAADFFTQYWWIVAIIAGLIILGLLSIWIKPLATVFVLIGKGLWLLIKWVPLLPFTLLYYGIKNAKERKG